MLKERCAYAYVYLLKKTKTNEEWKVIFVITKPRNYVRGAIIDVTSGTKWKWFEKVLQNKIRSLYAIIKWVFCMCMDVSHSAYNYARRLFSQKKKNRTNFDLVDKLLPVSSMASSGLKKMLDFIILYTPKKCIRKCLSFKFCFCCQI